MQMNVGDELTVTLPEDSGGGYLWQVEAVDGDAVTLASSEPGSLPPTSGVGGQRSRELTFLAVREGRADIHLVHQRPWEGPDATGDRFDATVVVQV